MSNEKTLEIIRGLSQAAANAYDGAHDERFSLDGQQRQVGLQREEGCALMDSRVIDGFKVKFYGDSIIINYQSDVRMKDLKDNRFENDIAATINDVKKFLVKEYKAITGNSITLTKKGEPQILVQQTSRVRTFVQAYQHYKVSGLSMENVGQPSEPNVRDITKKFLETAKAKRPQNEFIKPGDNQK
jgi:hypothetical protein